MWTVESDTEKILLEALKDLPRVPPRVQQIGDAEVSWREGKIGDVIVMAQGGSPASRHLAEQIVTADLEKIGYKRAFFTFDAKDDVFIKEAKWSDIEAKAKRLIQSGNVTILKNGWSAIIGHVKGDHGDYESEIGREDPESRAITQWRCSCPWDQYAWQRCVIEGSMITLANGRTIPVERICIGDAVIDHTGNIGIVSETHAEDWTKDIVRISATGFDDLVVKPDHPILVVPQDQVCCRNKNGSRAKFGKGRKGDFCALNTCGCRNPRTNIVKPIFKKAEDIAEGDFLVRPTLCVQIEQSEIDLSQYMSTAAIIEDNRIVHTREFETRWGTTTIAKHRKTSLPRTIQVTAGLLRLLGYYLAEGTITDHSIKFCFHIDEVEYHDDVCALGEEIFGVSPKFEYGQNTKVVSFNNTELATIFTNLVGRHVNHKKVPDWAMWLPSDLQSSLIDGWFKGDGHIRKEDGRYQLTTVSPQLANQAELILQRLGYIVGRRVERRSINHRSNKNERDAYTLYWLAKQNHNRGIRFRENDNTMVKITKVTREPYSGRLIDLSILGNPGYLAEGFAVHNTRQWKKYEGRCCSHILALFWKAQATPLDEGPPEGENLPPGQKGPEPEGGPSTSAPIPSTPQRSFGPEEAQGFSPPIPPLPAEQSFQNPPMAPPGQSGVLPAPPMEQQQLAEQMPPVPGQTPGGMPANPAIVSVPGAKMPTPFNPIQFPGGTYSSKAPEPPNYRKSGSSDKHCGNCKMYDNGRCWGYGNKNVDFDKVCDSWAAEKFAKVTMTITEPEDPEWRWYKDDEDRFMHNGCGPLALAIHKRTGWPMYATYSPEELNYRNEGEEYYHPNHVFVQHPSGQALDIRGLHPMPENSIPISLDQLSKSFDSEAIGIPEAHPMTDQVADYLLKRTSSTEFSPPEIVRLKNDAYGVAEGKSEAHGAGDYQVIPKNSQGELVYQDPTTGWIECRFPLDSSGPLEPYFVKVFLNPSDVIQTGRPVEDRWFNRKE